MKNNKDIKQKEKDSEEFEFAGRVREGIVVGDKMQKTIVVEVTRLMRHPEYGKIVRNKIKYLAHDEKDEAKMGNKVRIVSHRPISRRKRWKLVKVLSS